MTTNSLISRQRGGALLAVMWLSAALAAIAFSVASSVRGETERASTSVDEIRSYFLATGALERAVVQIQWGAPYYRIGQASLALQFPTGEVTVEIIPETSRLNINQAPPKQLYDLLLALGQDEAHASEIAQAIADWRTMRPDGVGLFDGYYASLTPSFRARHASFQEIEELLSVKGITPDLYYGTYARDTSVSPPQLTARGGLRDCVSVFGTTGAFDVNNAAPALLALSGLSPEAIRAIAAHGPFATPQDYFAFTQGNAMFGRLRFGGNSIFTLRATARLRLPDGNLSDLRRRVSETVKFVPDGLQGFVVLRWYDRG